MQCLRSLYRNIFHSNDSTIVSVDVIQYFFSVLKNYAICPLSALIFDRPHWMFDSLLLAFQNEAFHDWFESFEHSRLVYAYKRSTISIRIHFGIVSMRNCVLISSAKSSISFCLSVGHRKLLWESNDSQYAAFLKIGNSITIGNECVAQ